ncbi:MAG TPA: hypothetical protein VFA33_08775 [Bryobacteraceae bacterium]|nr:hypothetical protein [Bryobacteraceae bacterium]
MPALPLPQYGIENLYLFPCYGTPDAYQRATGKPAPDWNPNRAPKFWEDPHAKDNPKRTVVYDQALVLDDKGYPAVGPDGQPVLDLLVLNKDEAATVNIPPDLGNIPGANVPMVPPPLRALEPNEQLFFPFGGVVAVKNLDLYPSIERTFTPADRAVLNAIAKKLGA